MPEDIEAFGQLLDAFAAQGIASFALDDRTALVHAISASSPEAKLGVRQLRALTFLFFYGLPDESGPTRTGTRSAIPAADRAAVARAGAEDDRRREPRAATRRRSRPTCAWSARARGAA